MCTLAPQKGNQPSIVFYSRMKIQKLDGEGGIKELAEKGKDKKLLVITNKKHIERLQTQAGLTLLNSDSRYAILSNR